MIGDGEAETGPLATSWHSNKFLNPVHDGAVLPILHLNGYKIAGPTVLRANPTGRVGATTSRIWLQPVFCGRRRSEKDAQADGRNHGQSGGGDFTHPKKTRGKRIQKATHLAHDRAYIAQGLDRSEKVDGVQIEGTFRAHQVPLSGLAENPKHVKILEQWMKSYKPEELFDENGNI